MDMRYIGGTLGDCLCFVGYDPILKGYSNAYIAGNLDNRKLTIEFLFIFFKGSYIIAVKVAEMCCTIYN